MSRPDKVLVQAGDLYLMLHPYGAVVAAEMGLPASASASPTFT